MADIYTSKKDKEIISRVLKKCLDIEPLGKKMKILRIALEKSLQIDTEPDDSLDKVS